MFSGVASLAGVMQRVFETTIPEALANELDALGIRTPDQLGTALEDALKKLKAERLARGGPFTEDLHARLLKKSRSGPGSVKTSSTLPSPMCPRGDSNTRHAV
jgi:hypothetical protein